MAIILKETDLFDPKGMERLLSALTIFKKFKVELVSIYVDILKTDPSIEIRNRINTQNPGWKRVFPDLPAGTGYTIYGLEGEVNGSTPWKGLFCVCITWDSEEEMKLQGLY